MPVMFVSPKSVTFTFGALDASAQVTSVGVARSATTETLHTLGSSLTTSAEKEISISVELVFDPHESGISALLHAAWVAGTPGTIEVDYGGATSTHAEVTVTELGETADASAGQVTQSATITTGNPDVITWLTAA